MRRIFLVGFMGVGKTTIGKELSKQMHLSFVDLDHFIEGRFHKTIRQIFEEKGETIFREIEEKALHEVAEFENIIIATGGGTPCFHENMKFMNDKGITIYLKASIDELIKRVELNKNSRPILNGLSGKELFQFIEHMLAERAYHYELSQLIFETQMMNSELDVTNLSKQIDSLLTSINS